MLDEKGLCFLGKEARDYEPLSCVYIAKGIIKVCFWCMNGFEYDPKKSQSNLDKHGIDFETAQGIWQDADLIEVAVNTPDEPISLVIGKIGNKHWSAVITHRTPNIRIISVRRSRKAEVALYES
ncbi:BrnT family toxin [Neptuniibacter halophilus]|uniref:BrnT family toxin n=1 Tax=Neptuniibacter halophilus TaxID=651666 RepID=UPI002573E669|nr:BrnT family toxin [Neptuniibacter halophilus]